MATGSSHHPAGPSRLGRISLCPGSLKLCEEAAAKGLALEERQEEAEEGTDLHRLIGASPLADPTLPEEPFRALQKAREYIADRTQGAGKVLYEERLTVNFHEEVVTWGTCDVLALYPGKVRVIDLKFGRAELFRETVRRQMEAYACGAMQGLQKPVAEVFVFQPRTGVEYTESYADPALIAADLSAIVNAPASDLRPGLEQCKYCPAKTICPAFREEVQELTHRDNFSLSPAQLARALDFASLIGPWTDAVRAKAREVLETGMEIPGWELAERRKRVIHDAEKAWGYLSSDLEPGEFMRAVKVSVSKLEEVYARKLAEKGLTLKAGKSMFDAKLDGFAMARDVEKYLKRKEEA